MPAKPENPAGSVTRKTTRRLIPFLFFLFLLAYLDRINISFAQLQMRDSLSFGDAVYALGAGIFFIGYTFFEIPSNLALYRFGARIWIARIMISWGIVSTCMALINTPHQFYLLRFLLGVAEAGFFPGIILYLSYWFPEAERAKILAQFATATAIAGVIGASLSGFLLQMHGIAGLAGWQWLFIAEGLPSIAAGLAVLKLLTDKPEQADWLTPSERSWLCERMRQEHAVTSSYHISELKTALTSLRVWRLGTLYFCIVLSFYGIGMWLPQIIKRFSGMDNLHVSLLSALPYLTAAIVMVINGLHSDRSGERRLHVLIPAWLGACGLLLNVLTITPVFHLLGLCLAAAGIFSTLGPFWTLPSSWLRGNAAAGGIALINSLGNLGGFAGPYLVALCKTHFGGFDVALSALACILMTGSLLVLLE
ncbi:MFS transporter [Candidatus Methylospira mobilis]|uniref:MFS transporter n=1 Tax=Candidatus Methylospira mobilis TaxID=1808979 RepID=A0A5Q0BCY8_9GAMM|nr:MFS transporter [Candidatus Methylospira mobilis]QFY41670.1 MFS transporter [Candidatus Methylospira mobilis]